jgi:hypothetical protein
MNSRESSLLKCLVVLLVLVVAVGGLQAGKPVKPTPVDHKALQQPPIQLGTSGGSVTDFANSYCCSGTLGALVRIGGVQYILSNTHVFAGDSEPGGNGIVAAEGDDINQPGYVDTYCGTRTNIIVADLSDWCAIVPGGATPVDAAIAQVRSGMVRTDGAILEIGVLSSDTLAAYPGLGVKKSGRTTGLTSSTVDSINATISVSYSTECAGSSYTSTYTGQVLVKNKAEKFLAGGDSGSLLVENVATNPRAVGLLYAGSRTVAVANPIADVLGYFGATMVGQAAAGATAEIVPGEDTLPRGQLAKAMRLQQLNGNLLLKAPGAMGHAVGVSGGRPVIKILVEEITPEALAEAPQSIDGIPVVVEAVGKIVAF